MPKVYVILPSYRNDEALGKVLPSVVKTGVPHRLLLVNDSEGIENMGIPKKRNTLFKWALSDPEMKYVACVSNDCFPPENWVSTFMDFLMDNPNVGAVHGVEFADFGNGLGQYWLDPQFVRGDWLPAEDPRWDFEMFDATSLNCRCNLIRREVFEKVGFLDENFKLGSYDENDYGLRMYEAGFRNVVTGKVKFIHKVELNLPKFSYPHEEGGKYMAQKWPGIAGLPNSEVIDGVIKGRFYPEFEGEIYG